MTVPAPHSPWVAGTDYTTAALLQTISDSILYLLGSTTSVSTRRPTVQMRQTVAQSITSGTFTAVTFDAEDLDYDNGHSTAANTDRYTANTTAWYSVSGGVSYAANATGMRGLRYTVNGTGVNGSEVNVQAGPASVTTSVPGRTMLVFLNSGDILRVEAFQNSGGALNTSVAGSQQSTLTVREVSN